jgi:surface antigen
VVKPTVEVPHNIQELAPTQVPEKVNPVPTPPSNAGVQGGVEGGVEGGVVGGVVGSRAAKNEDRPVAIMVGTVLGAVIGAKIGRALDDADRACIGHALELAGEHSKVVWRNETTGVHYELTPTRNVGERRSPCREFTTVVSSGRVTDTVAGVACRRANGEWVFRS